MSSATAEKILAGHPQDGMAGLTLDLAGSADRRAAEATCFHCGEPCVGERFARAEKVFCCQGCLVVHELLAESGLEQFYELSRHPGVRVRREAKREQWACLDEPALQQRLLDFTDGKVSRVTFKIPAIHCVACVWLLENLFRLHPGIGKSQVNFPRREVALSFAPDKLSLSALVALLASIGYEPQLTLSELEKAKPDPGRKRRWLQVGLAGFAFGNIMLLSIPRYLGLDSFSGPMFRVLFGYLSLALAVPVVFYSAADYWRSALLSVRQRVLTLDVPIAAGLAALYAQSAFEVVSGRGEGYLDSLAGLVFFLLCGRVFQQKTHDRIVFDRDYKCFFPLSVRRQTASGEESVALSNLRVGDRLLLRNGELIPADAKLVSGPAVIDYSFVTGESEPVAKQAGDYLYAGGQQVGGVIEVETVKAVSQSYLTSLWNHEAFAKEREDNLNTLTNRYSRRFTRIVIAIAFAAALGWALAGQPARGLKAFTSVLIVACPCALALAAPFALGTAQRLLARVRVFLKKALVLERMAQVDAIVFDKTGTLTEAGRREVKFVKLQAPSSKLQVSGQRVFMKGVGTARPQFGPGDFSEKAGDEAVPAPVKGPHAYALGSGKRTTGLAATEELGAEEAEWVWTVAGQSTHPHSTRIREWLGRESQISDFKSPIVSAGSTGRGGSGAESSHDGKGFPRSSAAVTGFAETAGYGTLGTVAGHEIRLGSRAWLERGGVEVMELAEGLLTSSPTEAARNHGSHVYVAIDGECRGMFVLGNALRPETERLLQRLGRHYEMALLSGDNERERERFRGLFGEQARLHFNQSPLEKLGFIRGLQEAGKRVMMVGDGLNDAGALKQSDVGVAVVEQVGAFSPASDVIMAAVQVPRLFEMLLLARRTTRVVRLSFGISALYNVVGVSIAAAGLMSPVICAVLMPLSSVSVVLFACGAVNWAARRERF